MDIFTNNLSEIKSTIPKVIWSLKGARMVNFPELIFAFPQDYAFDKIICKKNYFSMFSLGFFMEQVAEIKRF